MAQANDHSQELQPTDKVFAQQAGIIAVLYVTFEV